MLYVSAVHLPSCSMDQSATLTLEAHGWLVRPKSSFEKKKKKVCWQSWITPGGGGQLSIQCADDLSCNLLQLPMENTQ